MRTPIHLPAILPLAALLDIQDIELAQCYAQGTQWAIAARHTYTTISDSDVIATFMRLILSPKFLHQDNQDIHRAIFSYLGIIHGTVLSPSGALDPQVTTLITLSDEHVTRGYKVGREDFFLELDAQEQVLTDSRVMDWLHTDALEYPLCGADRNRSLHFSLGCLFGMLSGHLFPWTVQEHQVWEEETIRILGYVCATRISPKKLVQAVS